MTDHILTKKRIKDIAHINDFDSLLSNAMISEEDIVILKYIYISNKDTNWIADALGYSATTIKRKHQKALKKISRLF